MEMNCQPHTPAALSLGKDPLVSIGYKVDWPLEPVMEIYIKGNLFEGG
jgi:hypothetical protein